MLFIVLLSVAFALATQSAAPITVTVDARDIQRGIYRVTEHMPVRPGPLTLWYPKWHPGEHSIGGPITSMLDFRLLADGKMLPWKRDLVEMYQFTSNVPSGISNIDIDFTLSDTSGTGHLARVRWIDLLWYPPEPTDRVTVQANLVLPEGWSAASALPVKSEAPGNVAYLPASFTLVADSPVVIGRYYKQFDVTGHSSVKHYLDVMADTEDALKARPETLDHLRRVHEELEAITGAHHYRDYHWLLTLSDNGGFDGLEHHECSEDGTNSNGFTPLGDSFLAELLCHEYSHSYNGKFRRPVGLCTPDFQKPMQDDLLWVYEGLTQFLGHLLACRSGWWSQEQWREQMATNYEWMNSHRGRDWRTLEDTAAGIPTRGGGRGASWGSATREQDYYMEMTMNWLEVDMRIRQLTSGRKSIEDFLRLFHGGPSRGPELKPYTLDDIVATLNQVCPYDWAGLLRERVYDLQPQMSTQGFELAGWRLVYNDTPNIMDVYARERLRLTGSIGAILTSDGTLDDVVPGSAADKAGLTPDMKIVSVNGLKYSEDAIKSAIKQAGPDKPIDLVVSYKEMVRPARLEYSGGMRYPHLERISGAPDRLADLLRPLAK